MNKHAVPDVPDSGDAGASVLGPEALAWRYVGEWRSLLGAGRALLLQVAHPVVGAGVRDYSQFRADPWSRLWATLESVMLQVYGGGRALDEAGRLRELHRTMRGIDTRGRPYHALHPAAYAWVHLSIFDTALAVQRWFGLPLTPGEEDELYSEWLRLGLVLGLRPRDMPGTLADFRPYVAEMVAGQLEDNQSVRDLLATVAGHGVPPPHRLIPPPLWAPVRPWMGRLLTRTTVGTLPTALRERLGLPWTVADERALARLGTISRTLVPRLPIPLRYHPTAAQAIRRARRGSAARLI